MSEPWVRTYSDGYEDCIIGNEDGLRSLASAIESAINEGQPCKLNEGTDADFHSVVPLTSGVEGSEAIEASWWENTLFSTVLVLWLILLPLLGILYLVHLARAL